MKIQKHRCTREEAVGKQKQQKYGEEKYSCRSQTRKMGFYLNKKTKQNKISTICLVVCLTFCGILLSDCNCKFKLFCILIFASQRSVPSELSRAIKKGTRRKRRSEGKADGKQNQAFFCPPPLQLTGSVCSHRSSLSSQTATFRSYQSGSKDVFWDDNVTRRRMIERERKQKQTESRKRH